MLTAQFIQWEQGQQAQLTTRACSSEGTLLFYIASCYRACPGAHDHRSMLVSCSFHLRFLCSLHLILCLHKYEGKDCEM